MWIMHLEEAYRVDTGRRSKEWEEPFENWLAKKPVEFFLKLIAKLEK